MIEPVKVILLCLMKNMIIIQEWWSPSSTSAYHRPLLDIGLSNCTLPSLIQKMNEENPRMVFTIFISNADHATIQHGDPHFDLLRCLISLNNKIILFIQYIYSYIIIISM